MVTFPSESTQARQLRYVGLRTQTNADHEVTRPGYGTIARTDRPTIARRVKFSLLYARVEANVAAKVELLVQIAEVITDFRPRRIELGELPISPQVLAGKLIHGAGRIDARTRITIPVPDTSKAAASLNHLD